MNENQATEDVTPDNLENTDNRSPSEAEENTATEVPVNEELPEAEELPVNKELEYYTRNFSFTQRSVILPIHPSVGERIRPSQLPLVEREIYQKMVDTRFWNNVNFDDFALIPVPSPPFRSVIIGKITPLGSKRYEMFLELEGFAEDYPLGIVLFHETEEIVIVLIRYLPAIE